MRADFGAAELQPTVKGGEANGYVSTPSGTAEGALPVLANTERTNAHYGARFNGLFGWGRKASAKAPQQIGQAEGPDEKVEPMAVPYADEKAVASLGYSV